MESLNPWALLRFLKFVSVFAYGASVGVALSPVEVALRKKAVHTLASPALLSTWIAGYLLTLYRGTPLTEVWVLGGFLISTFGQLVLVRTTRSRRVTPQQRVLILGSLFLTLLCMVFRPTWGRMGG